MSLRYHIKQRLVEMLWPLRIALWWLRTRKKCRDTIPNDWVCTRCLSLWPNQRRPKITDHRFYP